MAVKKLVPASKADRDKEAAAKDEVDKLQTEFDAASAAFDDATTKLNPLDPPTMQRKNQAEAVKAQVSNRLTNANKQLTDIREKNNASFKFTRMIQTLSWSKKV